MKRANTDRAEITRRDGALEIRYGKIGISAVAAALRYQSDGKNPAYAPCVIEDRYQDAEAA